MPKIHFLLLPLFLWLHLPVSSQIPDALRFIQIRNSVSIQDEPDSNLLLINAAEQGNEDTLATLIEQGYDVNQTTADGVTALMYASSNGFGEIVRILVENKAEINAVPYNGITALSSACINNHYETALYLLQQGADTEIEDNLGITPLLYAAAYDYFEITELLLMFGANPDHTDYEGATALHAAAIYARPDIAWLLLDYGAGIDSRDNFGFTPLMMAVQLGRREVVDYLLENNASIHLKTRDNLSVLAIAMANNHPEVAERLIEEGANPRERISYADNLMNLARWHGDDRLVSLMEEQGVRANVLPDFRTLRLSANVLLSAGDFFNGLQATLEDAKYNLLLTAGWYTRPVRRAILIEFSEGWHDQLWEQRHLFFGSLHKFFPLKYPFGLNEDGFYAGIDVMQSTGRYWGTYRYPQSRWHLVPSAGFYKAGSWWFYNIGYNYIQLEILNKSPHRISFGAGIRFNVIRDPVIYRTTYW
jgi:ankyrin repeat protein